MGGQDGRDWFVSLPYRGTRWQAHRAAYEPLRGGGRAVCASLHGSPRGGVCDLLAGPRAGACPWEGEDGGERRCTDKIHLPELRAQRLGEGRGGVALRRV